MATFKELTSQDIRTSRSYLVQLIDVIQQNISGSSTRRKYQHFVTGGVGPGVTSSLFCTVYDQDFTLQTANPIFDITVGLYQSGTTVAGSKTGQDSTGKLLFPSSSLMMREKVDIYSQFAQILLGDSTSQFVAPFDSTTTTDKIDAGMFVCFKRLFARDAIKRETFVMRFYQTASIDGGPGNQIVPNLDRPFVSGSGIFTDVGSSTNKNFTVGGEVGSIVDSSNTSRTVGLMFYDRGIAVFDLAKITSGSQQMSGTISAMNALGGAGFSAGQTMMGSPKSENVRAKFIPDFMVSASIDNIIDHICSCRFSSSAQTAITFQNKTNINSSLIACRVDPGDFCYSSNPSYTDSNNRIVVIDQGAEDTQQAFSFATKVGLYDANDNLLAVASFSRPIQVSPERSQTFTIRLDF